MVSPIGVKIKKYRRDDGSVYYGADPDYSGEQCPFCGSSNYSGGGSWSPGGCKDCGAIDGNHGIGWVKEVMEEQNFKLLALRRRIDHIVMWAKWRTYLHQRGWEKDKNGWYRSFNPLLPPDAVFYREPRYMSREGITLEEAVKLARHSDPDDSYIYT